MEFVRRQDVAINRLPGRDLQRLVGKGASMASMRMTVGTAHYSDASGPMAPHQHAEETIYVLDCHNATARYGPSADELPNIIPLEPGLTLHTPEWEWHVFNWEPGGGYADVIVIYGQVDNIRPEDVAAEAAAQDGVRS